MKHFFLLIISALPLIASAQLNVLCKDTNRINPYYRCDDPSFDPTCGCDNVTYRNGCEMTNIGGVNYPSEIENGVCRTDVFFFIITPIPAYEKIDFNMRFAENQTTPVTIQIYNTFGNLVLSRSFNSITSSPSPPITLYLSDLQTGVYTFVVRAGGIFQRKKFIKHTN